MGRNPTTMLNLPFRRLRVSAIAFWVMDHRGTTCRLVSPSNVVSRDSVPASRSVHCSTFFLARLT